jgi:hemolysin activation/secretion protein
MNAPALGRALALAALALAWSAPLAASPLPPLPEPSATERELLGARFTLREIRVEGATFLPLESLEAVRREFVGMTVGIAELRTIAARLTQAYVDRGYAASGVLYLSASADSGEASYLAVEGPISRVRYTSPPAVADPAWLTRQLVPDPAAPARLDELQERMAALRDSGIVDRVNARLEPLPGVGGSELVVSVEEPRPWTLAIDFDNYHSPVVGATRPSLNFAHRNVSGWGDRFDFHAGRTGGLEDISVAWQGILPRSQMIAGARFERSDSLAIDPPSFRELDIKTISETAGADLGWQFATRASWSLQARAAFERRRSETTLLGLPFSFVTGIPDGKSKANVWRGSLVSTERGEADVRFLRVQASVGRVTSELEELPEAPAARFRSYFLQAQYARRLTETGVQALVRLEGQYTRDRLLPIEKYSLGGHATVRGYRENVVLRDRGALASVELRTPLWRYGDALRIEGALFIDTSWSENTGNLPEPMPAALTSGGLTLFAAGPWGLSARVDLARPSHRWLTENADAQDRGLHFRLTWNAVPLLP